ncbi:hypothetical protein [Polynucleobacter sp. UB-Siik-W21]|jgi:hypothetical protein|uniref:hypothetical protein n=1 Tax=Polynucleobacter sp. UB-Siik-W21 TaxID=1855646 RepID=UPI001BFE43F3|nr:hypothetical protein [Polynucleobacter sp. UB-Siik-W21]QWD70385.1 hypothetical protein C2756_10920 [Polynucleobacter sp. UB-Siik-W21]
MENSSGLAWIVAIALGIMLYNAKNDAKEFNKHSLSRMQYVESNLIDASKKVDDFLTKTNQACYNTYYGRPEGLCGAKQDIANALVDVRPELEDLHKKLKD